MKILKPALTSASNYTFEARRLCSSSGVADAGAALYTASGQGDAITSVSINTVDADIVHTIRFVRKSDKKKMHECSFKHSRLANKRTKILKVNFVTVAGNKIKTEQTEFQKHEFATYTCMIGENALPTATQLELSISGGHGADSGSMEVEGLASPVTISFSGNGQIEWEFPVQMVTGATVDVQTQARQIVDNNSLIVFGDTMSALYGSDVYVDNLTFDAAFRALVFASAPWATMSPGSYDALACANGTLSGSTEAGYAAIVNAIAGLPHGATVSTLNVAVPALGTLSPNCIVSDA